MCNVSSSSLTLLALKKSVECRSERSDGIPPSWSLVTRTVDVTDSWGWRPRKRFIGGERTLSADVDEGVFCEFRRAASVVVDVHQVRLKMQIFST